MVNETKGEKKDYDFPIIPKPEIDIKTLRGTKQILDEQGAEGVVKWIKEQKKLFIN